MSQRKEKYARSMEQRTGVLERRVDKLEESRDRIGKRLGEYGRRLAMAERNITVQNSCRQRRRIEWDMERLKDVQGIALTIGIVALLIAVIALIVAGNAMVDKPGAETAPPAVTVTPNVEAALIAVKPAEIGPWDFAAMFQAAEDPAEKQRIGEALEAQGYFSPAVPLSWECQDYIRTYCRLYGCPYPLALAVADWETRGQFNMDAIGPAGEVGIFQLNPGPDGVYHAELEEATGLDPTTPEGNVAGGCYKLGNFLARYEDTTKALMAYNMGASGARSAWEEGITSTGYTDAVLEALERWECVVSVWAAGG